MQNIFLEEICAGWAVHKRTRCRTKWKGVRAALKVYPAVASAKPFHCFPGKNSDHCCVKGSAAVSCITKYLKFSFFKKHIFFPHCFCGSGTRACLAGPWLRQVLMRSYQQWSHLKVCVGKYQLSSSLTWLLTGLILLLSADQRCHSVTCQKSLFLEEIRKSNKLHSGQVGERGHLMRTKIFL